MNKVILETDVVEAAHAATHRVRQPSWAAHCAALSINLDEAEEEAEKARRRPTMRIKTPAYDFRPTPLYTVVPPKEARGTPPLPLQVKPVEELDLDWDG